MKTKDYKHSNSSSRFKHSRRKISIGYVVSNKMQKTLVVEIEVHKSHMLYGKTMRTTKRIKVHNQNNNLVKVGDRISLMETRPISASKHWRLVKVLKQAK